MSLDGKFPDWKNYTFKTIPGELDWQVLCIRGGGGSKVNENIYQSNLSPKQSK